MSHAPIDVVGVAAYPTVRHSICSARGCWTPGSICTTKINAKSPFQVQLIDTTQPREPDAIRQPGFCCFPWRRAFAIVPSHACWSAVVVKFWGRAVASRLVTYIPYRNGQSRLIRACGSRLRYHSGHAWHKTSGQGPCCRCNASFLLE